MTPEQMKEVVVYIDGRAETECSGNVTPAGKYPENDRCRVGLYRSGALTHSAPILTFHLKNLHRIKIGMRL